MFPLCACASTTCSASSYLFIYLFIRSPAQLFKGNKMGPMGRALFMAKRFEANFVLPSPTPLHSASVSVSDSSSTPLSPFSACRGGQAVLDSTSTSTDTGGIILAGPTGQSIWRIGFIYGTFIMKCQSKVVAPSASL